MIFASLTFAQNCGPNVGRCVDSGCSEWGWCGLSLAHTSGNCFPEHSAAGKCVPLGKADITLNGVSTDGICGVANGKSCASPNCCSKWGYCGNGAEWCDNQLVLSPPVAKPTEAPTPPPTTGPIKPAGNAYTLPQSEPIQGCVNNKEVTMTIDDGPHKSITAQTLELLTKLKMPATFFQIGVNIEQFSTGVTALKNAMAKNPELFSVASHTYSHLNSLTISVDQVKTEAEKASELIKNFYGVKPRFFRPPQGDYNAATLKVWNDMNMFAVLWTAGMYYSYRFK